MISGEEIEQCLSRPVAFTNARPCEGRLESKSRRPEGGFGWLRGWFRPFWRAFVTHVSLNLDPISRFPADPEEPTAMAASQMYPSHNHNVSHGDGGIGIC